MHVGIFRGGNFYLGFTTMTNLPLGDFSAWESTVWEFFSVNISVELFLCAFFSCGDLHGIIFFVK